MVNRKTKKLQKKVCYTGVGSKKNGNYSLKNFFSLMEKNFKKDCSRFLRSKKCKPCKKLNKTYVKYFKKMKSKKTTKKYLDKYYKKIDKESLECEKCKNKNNVKCTVKDYMYLSGAKYGKC
jgi:hypothetical protein